MINKITLDERGQIMDIGIMGAEKTPFSMWINIIRIGTDLTDEQIGEMDNPEILTLGGQVLEKASPMSKKKK
jgi:hypothetical protein